MRRAASILALAVMAALALLGTLSVTDAHAQALLAGGVDGQAAAPASVSASGAAPQYACSSATATCELDSPTNDATTSATVAAITLKATANVTDADLILAVRDSAGNARLAVSESGQAYAPKWCTTSNCTAFVGPSGEQVQITAQSSLIATFNGAGTPYGITGEVGLTNNLASKTSAANMTAVVPGWDIGSHTAVTPAADDRLVCISYDLGGTPVRVACVDKEGDLSLSGGVSVGGGTSVASILTATATLDFPNSSLTGCDDLTVTVTGAVANDICDVGPPVAFGGAESSFSCAITSANTATVRHCSHALIVDPASATYRVTVLHY